MTNNNEQTKQSKKNFDWKFLVSSLVSVVAVVVAIIACIKGGPAGPAGQPGQNGNNGSSGLSAYQIAVANGFTGTEAEWISSLQGAAGATGLSGQDGADGSSVLTGNGVPANTLGENGDSYIDLQTWNFYVKSSDAWSSAGNIKGESGSSSSGEESLSSLDDYFGLLDDTRKFNFEVEDNYNEYYLKNSADVETIYDNVEPASYSFKINSRSLPCYTDTLVDEGDPDTFYYELYTKHSCSNYATMEINKIGSGSDSYVALRLENQRNVVLSTYSTYFEQVDPIFDDPMIEDITMSVQDSAYFTKVGSDFCMIYSSPTFNHYYIQKFNEDIYKIVVSSIIYGMTSLPYFEGKDYYIGIDDVSYYRNNLIASKNSSGAKAQFNENYKSKFTTVGDKLSFLSTTFDDSLGLLSLDPYRSNHIEQELSIVYGDSGYSYPTTFPTGNQWPANTDDAAYDYAIDEAAIKPLLTDATNDLECYSSIIWQILDIFRNTYVGVMLSA